MVLHQVEPALAHVDPLEKGLEVEELILHRVVVGGNQEY